MIRCFGGEVSWENSGSYVESDPSITHQIVDRDFLTQNFPNREYLQPQWVFGKKKKNKIKIFVFYLLVFYLLFSICCFVVVVLLLFCCCFQLFFQVVTFFLFFFFDCDKIQSMKSYCCLLVNTEWERNCHLTLVLSLMMRNKVCFFFFNFFLVRFF